MTGMTRDDLRMSGMTRNDEGCLEMTEMTRDD